MCKFVIFDNTNVTECKTFPKFDEIGLTMIGLSEN